MPPAFVLSQDQTLKFIPDPPKGEPKQGPPNVRILREPWRPLRPPSAHPFPLLHNLKQPSPQGQPPTRPKGAALIRPSRTPRQHPIRRRCDARSACLGRHGIVADVAPSRDEQALRITVP